MPPMPPSQKRSKKRVPTDEAVSVTEYDARSEPPSEPRPVKKAKHSWCELCEVKPSPNASNWADCETNDRGKVVPLGPYCALEAEFASSLGLTAQELGDEVKSSKRRSDELMQQRSQYFANKEDADKIDFEQEEVYNVVQIKSSFKDFRASARSSVARV
jgi:hypothetical protein